MNRRRSSVWPLLACCVMPLLAACENSATAFRQEGRNHAIMLVREQPYFWSEKIDQYIVASNLPECQRRVRIYPGVKPLMEMRVYWAGDHLWALHQGRRWYLVSTAPRCQVQDWDNEEGKEPGALLGRFVWSKTENAPVFVEEKAAAPAPEGQPAAPAS